MLVAGHLSKAFPKDTGPDDEDFQVFRLGTRVDDPSQYNQD